MLRHVDLDVAEGEIVALLGANGSGKSTLVRAAVGLVPLDSGEVELFGTPLAKFRQRHRLGYVPQHSRAAAGVPATVHEVVMSGRLSRRPYAGLARQSTTTRSSEPSPGWGCPTGCAPHSPSCPAASSSAC